MSKHQNEIPYGALELLILKTLDVMGRMHGYGIARRIEQVSGREMPLSQGAIYPALIRLEQQRVVTAAWGVSETNRRVKIYALTAAGRKQLVAEARKWERATALVAKFMDVSS
jgi:transcriptional regulator